jgi:hypothetical protein
MLCANNGTNRKYLNNFDLENYWAMLRDVGLDDRIIGKEDVKMCTGLK